MSTPTGYWPDDERIQNTMSNTDDLEAKAREWWLSKHPGFYEADEREVSVAVAFARSLAQPPSSDLRRGDVAVFADPSYYSAQLIPQGTEFIVLSVINQEARVVNLDNPNLNHHGWYYGVDKLRLRDAALAHPKDPAPTVERDRIKDVAREWILAHDGPESEDDAEHILEDLVERLKTLFP